LEPALLDSHWRQFHFQNLVGAPESGVEARQPVLELGARPVAKTRMLELSWKKACACCTATRICLPIGQLHRAGFMARPFQTRPPLPRSAEFLVKPVAGQATVSASKSACWMKVEFERERGIALSLVQADLRPARGGAGFGRRQSAAWQLGDQRRFGGRRS